jgi:Ca2+/Na+ antiporter
MPARVAVWIIALVWMGTACILNARRCGRTHCRYTGPFYFAMILPVMVLASGVAVMDFYGWLAFALFIVCAGWIIWWGTEQAWGKFTHS